MRRAETLSLLTDLYQLTMAYAYWKSGTHTKEAVFHLYFRNNPFGGGFSVACGLQSAIDYLNGFRFGRDEIRFLSTLKGNDGEALFERKFLDYLQRLKLSCNVDAIPEGTVVFPNQPLLRVQGPIVECQLFETALLNLINFQTLIATKAARVCLAAKGDAVFEFGLRRAQGIDGALSASRAAYVGGCVGTSNVLAAKKFGIPVKGTHAHSWVMSFDTEMQAFEEYAKAMPNNCVFLVDTYNTLEGVRHAARAGLWLRKRGHKMIGIRLDSGDLAYLSIEARKILDASGLENTAILASNDLDEKIIASLKEQGAMIAIWGVGTRLATAYDQPALGGVYKLSAMRIRGGKWQNKVKLSEQAIKVSNPGVQQVRRFRVGNEFVGDIIFDTAGSTPKRWKMIDPFDPTRQKVFAAGVAHEDLLVPVFRRGKLVYQSPPLSNLRQRTSDQLELFHPGIKRFVNPHAYPVGLESGLARVRQRLIERARDQNAVDVSLDERDVSR